MKKRLTSIGPFIGILILGLATTSQASKCQYPFATKIIHSTPPVNQAPENILGAPDGVAVDFDSQGRTPSTVVVGFASNIINREGSDFSITYQDLPENERVETSEILVKGPGYNFTRIGIIEPIYGLTEENVSQTAFFDLDTIRRDSISEVMIRNFEARSTDDREGLDIDGFTAIHCDDGTPSRDDRIALHVSGLRHTKATCWNTANHNVVPANKDSEGMHSCAHLFTNQGDSISLTIVGTSTRDQ